MSEKQVLIVEDGFAMFTIEFTNSDDDYSNGAEFTVCEVRSWDADTSSALDYDHYLKGYVKWDGCSHIWFGDEDGYLHLCGRSEFDLHHKVMSAIWDVCKSKITNFDEDAAQ